MDLIYLLFEKQQMIEIVFPLFPLSHNVCLLFAKFSCTMPEIIHSFTLKEFIMDMSNHMYKKGEKIYVRHV